MKIITTFKLLQVTILLSVLILLTIARSTSKKNRNNKHTSKRVHRLLEPTKNTPPTKINKAVGKPKKEDPIAIAKGKCKEKCDEELTKSKNEKKQGNAVPIKNDFSLYTKKKVEDFEYYLCECRLSDENRVLQKEYFYANKSNVQLFIKGDDDGDKFYKKDLSDKVKTIYKLVSK